MARTKKQDSPKKLQLAWWDIERATTGTQKSWPRAAIQFIQLLFLFRFALETKANVYESFESFAFPSLAFFNAQ